MNFWEKTVKERILIILIGLVLYIWHIIKKMGRDDDDEGRSEV